MGHTMMDEASRYEVDCEVQHETAPDEIRILEKRWLSSGPMKTLRLDSLGAHMSREFMKWPEGLGTRVKLIARGALLTLGMLERNHQVRSVQIASYQEAHPLGSLKKTLVVTCSQRYRRRKVDGFTPVQRVFGATPNGTCWCLLTNQLRDSWPHCHAGSFYVDTQRMLSAAKSILCSQREPSCQGSAGSAEPSSQTSFSQSVFVSFVGVWKRAWLASCLPPLCLPFDDGCALLLVLFDFERFACAVVVVLFVLLRPAC